MARKIDAQVAISQEIFDSMLLDAIEDLRKSGLDGKEVFVIVKEQFGLQ